MTTDDHAYLDQPAAGRLRAGDADRERTAEQLRGAHADGRISADELAERIGACFQARTFGELQRLTADLALPARPGVHRIGRHPRHQLRFVLAALAALWLLTSAVSAVVGGPAAHPQGFPFLLVLLFALLVVRLVRAVRA